MNTIVRRDHWTSRARLDDLLACLTACLPEVPGFRTLSIFGSLAEDRADGYSDLDLIVTTDDLPVARAHLLSVLETVGPVESCWVFSRPGEWIPTVILADEGYYHKLDIGLVSTDVAHPTIPPQQTTLLVTGSDGNAVGVPRASRAYLPPEGSVGHFLLGQCLGGMRYVKARKRGQPLTCYRFAAAAADWCLRALYCSLTGQGELDGKLSTEEYATLDRMDTDNRGLAILAVLDYTEPARMDRTVCGIFREMHDLCCEIALTRGETLPDAVFQRMLAFLHEELAAT